MTSIHRCLIISALLAALSAGTVVRWNAQEALEATQTLAAENAHLRALLVANVASCDRLAADPLVQRIVRSRWRQPGEFSALSMVASFDWLPADEPK